MTDEEAKKRVYRRYCRGDASVDDVADVFGEDMDEFRDRREFIAVIEASETIDADDDLFC